MFLLKDSLAAVLGYFSAGPHKQNVQNAHEQRSQPKPQTSKRSASDAYETVTIFSRHTSNKRSKLPSGAVGFNNNAEESPATGTSITRLGSKQPASPTPMLESQHDRKRSNVDRALMPPPSAAFIGHKKRLSLVGRSRLSLDQAETASQTTRSSWATKTDLVDEYDMEEARRKAAATQLPPNSGIWETGERELFFHLSYRGFEPLLPQSWMIDFPTLPISVFAHQDTDTPLIECHRSTPFRAIRALRELVDTGTTIRDRIVSSKELRTEPILSKAVAKYLSWSFKDMGYPDKPSKTRIPVHTVATLQLGQSTNDVIRVLATEMHILAAKHREAVNVRPSVEQAVSDRSGSVGSEGEPTQIYPAITPDERPLPVIYGIMIASSVLGIFTLNSHTPFPPFMVRALLRSVPSPLTPEKAATLNPLLPGQLQNMSSPDDTTQIDGQDEDSGIRYIASFDFSNPSADVWNALVIAILAMQIRKTLGETYETWQQIKDSQQLHIYREGQSSPYAPAGQANVEDSWLSNVDGCEDASFESPVSSFVDTLLKSSGVEKKVASGRKPRTKGKNVVRNPKDPDA